MINPCAGQFLEAVEHQVAHIGGPLADHAVAQRTSLATEIHHVAVDTAHFEDQGANPVRHLGHFDAGQFLDAGGVAVFVEVRFGHADATDDGEDLDEGAPFHQFLEAAMEIADMGLAFDHFVAADGELHRHVAGNAGVIRALPEL